LRLEQYIDTLETNLDSYYVCQNVSPTGINPDVFSGRVSPTGINPDVFSGRVSENVSENVAPFNEKSDYMHIDNHEVIENKPINDLIAMITRWNNTGTISSNTTNGYFYDIEKLTKHNESLNKSLMNNYPLSFESEPIREYRRTDQLLMERIIDRKNLKISHDTSDNIVSEKVMPPSENENKDNLRKYLVDNPLWRPFSQNEIMDKLGKYLDIDAIETHWGEERKNCLKKYLVADNY